MDELCASGELVWIGAGVLGRNSGRVALYFRDDVAVLGPPSGALRSAAPAGDRHDAVRDRLGVGACFFSDLLGDAGLGAEDLSEVLWDLVWSGEATNDAFAPLRARRLTLTRYTRSAPAAFAQRRRAAPGRFAGRRPPSTSPLLQGRWSLTESLFRDAPEPDARRRALAEVLLERYGILTREQVRAEGIPGGFAGLYPELSQLEVLGLARRGYFVESLGGAQFALPGAVERLRSVEPGEHTPVLLSAVDPAQPYGAVLPWPTRDRDTARRPTRVAGAYVVLSGGDPVLFLERGGRAMETLVAADDPRVRPALAAIVEEVRCRRIRRVALEQVDGAPAMSSVLAPALMALGFQEGPRRLTLSA
jgi:ATP-dependent Lhr-like helicase